MKDEKRKKPEKKKSKLRKTIDWIFSIVTGVFLVALLGIQINALVTKDTNHGVPNYFGYSYMYVLTNSMESDDPALHGIAKGSAVFTEKVDPTEIKVDDDVTFIYNLDGLETDTQDERMRPFTHRIFKIETKEVSDGKGGMKTVPLFYAHGINENAENFKPDEFQVFTEERLIGRVVWTSKAVGSMINFLASWQGLLVILLIPCGYLIIVSAFDIFKALKTEDNEEEKASTEVKKSDNASLETGALSEEDRQRLKKELLNEMLNKKEGDK